MSKPKDTPIPASPEWYRAQAQRLADLASMALVPQIKARLTAIVQEYEALALSAEKAKSEG